MSVKGGGVAKKEEFIVAPDCTTKDNKHILITSKNPYYKECSACGEKFALVSENCL